MTNGQARQALRDLADTIDRVPSGDVRLSWHTVHGLRVVEVSAVTIHVADALADGTAKTPASQGASAESSLLREWGAYWLAAFRESVRTAFPKRRRS